MLMVLDKRRKQKWNKLMNFCHLLFMQYCKQDNYLVSRKLSKGSTLAKHYALLQGQESFPLSITVDVRCDPQLWVFEVYKGETLTLFFSPLLLNISNAAISHGWTDNGSSSRGQDLELRLELLLTNQSFLLQHGKAARGRSIMVSATALELYF